VAPILGRKKIQPEKIVREDQVGVATGMYYTPAGGDIMFIEAALMRGKGEVLLTGQLGDVMKESARAAWTFARSHATFLGIDDTAFERDLHIHVPAGAIPKDGPSAGITMATALVSALTRVPTRKDVAMTGEITLRGKVLPIGGVKEKLLAAHRAGIRTIVLPRENEKDLADIPKLVLDVMEIHLAETMDEVLKVALAEPLPPPISPAGPTRDAVVPDDVDDTRTH
jgi:ATP-dependent Lon protease